MKNTGNITKLILLFASAALLLGSCQKDPSGSGISGGKGEKEIEMTFLTPAGQNTRAAIAAEDDLKDITLLVFEGSAGTSKFLYSRYAWRSVSGTNKFKTTLKLGDDLTIYFAANAKSFIQELIDDGDLVEGATTWAQLKELLVMDNPGALEYATKGLPMWGHKYDVDIADKPNNALGTVNLLRAVASTDITVGATNFTLQKGHVVFASDKGYLAYDPTLLSGSQVTAPQSPSGMLTTETLSKTVAAGVKEISNYFYMYENATSLTPTGTNRPTKVVLEGVWTGDSGSGETTFYPLSFRDENSSGGYDKKQVTRNNKYLIVVTNVNGDGWGSLDEAKDADDVNMEYDVIEWNENEDGEIMIDGPKYFYREATGVTLKYNKHTEGSPNTKEIVVRTNFDLDDLEMKFGTDGTPASDAVANDRFKAEVLEVDPNGVSGDGDEYMCFRFTALKDYAADTDNPSILYVTVGRLSFTFTVTQDERIPEPWEDGGNTGVDL